MCESSDTVPPACPQHSIYLLNATYLSLPLQWRHPYLLYNLYRSACFDLCISITMFASVRPSVRPSVRTCFYFLPVSLRPRLRASTCPPVGCVSRPDRLEPTGDGHAARRAAPADSIDRRAASLPPAGRRRRQNN